MSENKPSDLQLAESNYATSEHIREVCKNIHKLVKMLLDRADIHDNSKFEHPEVDPFSLTFASLHGPTYASSEYESRKVGELKVALDHHYANNRHHPQHFKEGVKDMNLVDILEMFCDWLAASKRHANGNIRISIEKNSDKYHMGSVLTRIFENTADLFDE
jgi:hypothetical protein